MFFPCSSLNPESKSKPRTKEHEHQTYRKKKKNMNITKSKRMNITATCPSRPSSSTSKRKPRCKSTKPSFKLIPNIQTKAPNSKIQTNPKILGFKPKSTNTSTIQYHPKPRSTTELDLWPTTLKKTRSNQSRSRSRPTWLGFPRLQLDQDGPSLGSLLPCAAIASHEFLIAHGCWSEWWRLSRRIGYGVWVTVIVVGFGSSSRQKREREREIVQFGWWILGLSCLI